MTKPFNPNTVKGAVQRVLGLLGDAGVSAVTGKSAALVRKWADPDADGHNIPAFQAIALDAECQAQGHGRPISEAMGRELAAQLPLDIPPPPMAPGERLVACVADFGKVADALRVAMADNNLTAGEKHRVQARAIEARAQLDRLIEDMAPPPRQRRAAAKAGAGRQRKT